MSAALDQQAFRHRAPHNAAEIDAGDRAAGAGTGAARLDGDGESRPPVTLLKPRRDQSDHARMPALLRGDDHRAFFFEAKRRERLGVRLPE